jgi:hypothetical protein
MRSIPGRLTMPAAHKRSTSSSPRLFILPVVSAETVETEIRKRNCAAHEENGLQPGENNDGAANVCSAAEHERRCKQCVTATILCGCWCCQSRVG